MIAMFENDKVFIAPDTDINKLLDKGWNEADIEKEIERLAEENPKTKHSKQMILMKDFGRLKKDGFIKRIGDKME